jgi:hypothetical protein
MSLVSRASPRHPILSVTKTYFWLTVDQPTWQFFFPDMLRTCAEASGTDNILRVCIRWPWPSSWSYAGLWASTNFGQFHLFPLR